MITPDQRYSGTNGSGGPAAGETSNLVRRVASAAVLGPIAILAAYVGGWPFLLVCALAAVAILWEWAVLVTRSADPRILAPGWAALLAGTVLAGAGFPGTATSVIAVGAVLVGVATAIRPRAYPAQNPSLWASGGVIYAGIALLGPSVLRRDAELGFKALLFLFATVWITDVFAYFVGRAMGGPLLWPRLSPKKTWAGAFGGLLGGVVAGTLVAYASGLGRLGVLGIVAAVLSVLAQGGDLFESAVKRRFGAKDASRLIPGHGGVMDRLDGFLVAALAAVLIGVLRQGTGAPAQGLLLW